MVELRNVTKSDTGVWLNQMNYHFQKTGLYGLLGSKKERATFLKLISMEDLDFEGSILYHGQNILPHDTHEFIEKNVCVLSSISLEENKSILGNLKDSKVQEEEIIKDLKRFGLEEMGRKRVKTLTEEEKKVVQILKAIYTKKELYILDEEDILVHSNYQKKIWKKIESLSKKALVVIGLSKKKALENIHFLRLENGNLKEEREEQELVPKKEEMTPTTKKVEKEKRLTSIFFFAFIFFFLFTALTFQTIRSHNIHYETLKHENEWEIFLKLKGQPMSEEEIKHLSEIAHISFGKSYSEIGTFMGLSGKKAVTSSDYPIFYNAVMSIPVFYVIDDNTNIDLLIGELPKNESEIVITKTVADFILYKGILTTENNFLEPKDYEELIASANNVSYGGIPVKIVGITNDKFESKDTFKTKEESELTKEEYYSYQDFSDRNANYHITYVNEYFNNYIKLESHGKKISENITELRVMPKNKEALQEIINTYSNSRIEIESIVSNRLEKYEPLLKALKVIGSILTFIFILCFFLQVLYIIVYDIKYLKKKEAKIIKELTILLSFGCILGLLLYFGYTALINIFISHKLFIYFHILEIHLFPALLIILCTYTITYCLIKYFSSET